MHLRMSERELAAAKALAGELDMTVSDLVRVLLQLPADSVGTGARLVVVDRTTAAKLSREMTRWGHHYNQAVHALNAIAYYLRANDMDAPDVLEELVRAERKLEEMRPAVDESEFTPISLTPSTPPKRPPAHASPRTPRG